MSTPALQVKPRRFASPFVGAQAKLEPIHQPLYSAYLMDAAQVLNEALFFQYAIGGTVASNIATATTANELHTNMRTGNLLSSPKMFLTTGIRIVVAELSSGLINPIDDSAATTRAAQTFTGEDSNLLEDLLRIFYGSFVKFFVGTKDYLIAPTWFTPANAGVVGEMSDVATVGASATNVSTSQRYHTLHTRGRYFALDRYPVLIPPQQNFYVSLNFPQTTRPTLGASHAVYAVLDGILGREVQ